MTQQAKIPAIWLSKAKDRNIKEILESSPTLVEIFLSVLDQMEQEDSRQETSQADYDSPSWAYKQADRNGARRAYGRVRGLFTFLKNQ